ncbi:MAG TPA: M20 family metallopeptidase [Candidatus Omnitrophota bacterium]|nr:M20 family metallopeptidase [Candidatus Omnitrophota bacterium]
MVNKKRLIQTLQKLISLDSQNPPGNEHKIAAFVSKYLADLGLEIKIYTFSKKRDNVIARLPGGKRHKSLLLTPHLDTVPAGISWKTPALSAKIVGNRIYGLGATDCKGNLASALEAINSLVEDGVKLEYDLIFAATADEESGSALGLIPLLERKLLKADAAVVLDADDFEIVITQKGLMHLTVKVEGKKAHGAYPWLGINAIDLAAKIITDLKSKHKSYAKNKYLHPPTVNVGTIKGGDKVNVVSDWCEFELDFRFLPGYSEKEILRFLKETIIRHARKYKITIQGIQDPYYIDPSHPLVSSLVAAMKSLRLKGRISGSEGATVITFFKALKIPAIATGFGTEGCAHIADEYACLDNLYNGAKVLVEFLKKYKFN